MRLLTALSCSLGIALAAACSNDSDPTSGEAGDDTRPETASEADGAAEAPRKRPKVAIFGVDGATFTVIDPLIAEGRLPHMARLIERGAGVVLRKPERYNASPVLWSTIMTGTMPDTHGILNFGKVEKGVLSVYASTDRKVPAIWNLVTARGGSVGVMGVWNTWPAEPVDGYVVSDRFCHSLYQRGMGDKGDDAALGITHPEDLTGELRHYVRAPDDLRREEIESLGKFSDAEWREMMMGDKGDDAVVGNGLVALKYGWQAQETIAAASLHMLRTHEQPDLFVTFLELPDRVGHHFWHAYAPDDVTGGAERVEAEWRRRWNEIVPRAYERVDWWMGQMLAELEPDTTIIVVSDHGMQSSHTLGGTLADLAKMAKSGMHHDDGILLAAGPAIRQGAKTRATIVDVAPLTLVALGMPLSTQFEGHILKPLIDPAFLREHPQRAPVADDHVVRTAPEGVDAAAVDEEFIKHLGAIGYTDGSDKLLADVLDDDPDSGGMPTNLVRDTSWVAPCQCCVEDAPLAHCEEDPTCAECAACPACAICDENPGH